MSYDLNKYPELPIELRVLPIEYQEKFLRERQRANSQLKNNSQIEFVVKEEAEPWRLKDIAETEKFYIGAVDDNLITCDLDYGGTAVTRAPVISVRREALENFIAKQFGNESTSIMREDLASILSLLDEMPLKIFYLPGYNGSDAGEFINTSQILSYMLDNMRIDLIPLIDKKRQVRKNYKSLCDNALKEIVVAEKLYMGKIGSKVMCVYVDDNGKNIEIPIISAQKEIFYDEDFKISNKEQLEILSGDIIYLLDRFKNEPTKFYYLFRHLTPNMDKFTGKFVDTEEIKKYIDEHTERKFNTRKALNKLSSLSDELLLDSKYQILKEISEAKELYIGLIDGKLVTENIEKDGEKISAPLISATSEYFNIISAKSFNNKPIDTISGDITFLLGKFKENLHRFFYISKNETRTLLDAEKFIQIMSEMMGIDVQSLIEKHQQERTKSQLKNIFEAKKLFIGMLENEIVKIPCDKNGKKLYGIIVSITPESFDYLSAGCFNNKQIKTISVDLDFILYIGKKENSSGFYFVPDENAIGQAIFVESDLFEQFIKDKK